LTEREIYVPVLFMFDAQPVSEDAACEADAAARVARQQGALQELAELGMRIARAICAEAEAPTEPGRKFAGDPALMFSRVSRAVRMTLALETRLAEESQARRQQHAATATARTQQVLADQHAENATRALHKGVVRELVEAAIESELYETPEARENLLADLDERLADPVEDAEFRDRPIADWAADICRRLGVTFDPAPWGGGDDWGLGERAPRPTRRPDQPGPMSPESCCTLPGGSG
jgi:hypothetical protein